MIPKIKYSVYKIDRIAVFYFFRLSDVNNSDSKLILDFFFKFIL